MDGIQGEEDAQGPIEVRLANLSCLLEGEKERIIFLTKEITNIENQLENLNRYIGKAETEEKNRNELRKLEETLGLHKEKLERTREKLSEEEKKEEQTVVYYVTDEQQQSQYIKMFKEQSQDAVILTHNIDTPFITYMEQHNENIKFQRIDA